MKKLITTVMATGLMVLLLASCSNALDRKYNTDTFREDLEVLIARDQVNQEDLATMAIYIAKCNIQGVSLEGKTYREILEESKGIVNKDGDIEIDLMEETELFEEIPEE